MMKKGKRIVGKGYWQKQQTFLKTFKEKTLTILEVYHQKKLFCQKQPVSLNWKKIEGRDNQKIQKKLLSLKRRRNEHWKRRKMRGKEEKTNTEKEEETNFWKRRNERWKDDWRNGHSFWWKSFGTTVWILKLFQTIILVQIKSSSAQKIM